MAGAWSRCGEVVTTKAWKSLQINLIVCCNSWLYGTKWAATLYRRKAKTQSYLRQKQNSCLHFSFELWDTLIQLQNNCKYNQWQIPAPTVARNIHRAHALYTRCEKNQNTKKDIGALLLMFGNRSLCGHGSTSDSFSKPTQILRDQSSLGHKPPSALVFPSLK